MSVFYSAAGIRDIEHNHTSVMRPVIVRQQFHVITGAPHLVARRSHEMACAHSRARAVAVAADNRPERTGNRAADIAGNTHRSAAVAAAGMALQLRLRCRQKQVVVSNQARSDKLIGKGFFHVPA